MSYSTTQRSKENLQIVTEWPSVCPAKNPKENLWGKLPIDMHTDGQFVTVQDLKLKFKRSLLS